MKTIFKYPITLLDYQVLSIPKDYTPICIGVQHDNIYLWAYVNTDEPVIEVPIAIIGTGQEFASFSSWDYLGTAIISSGFVWHVFRRHLPGENKK